MKKEYEKNKLEKYDIKDSLNQVLKDRLNRIRDLIRRKIRWKNQCFGTVFYIAQK